MKYLFLFILGVSNYVGFGQMDIIYQDHIYVDYIKSVEFGLGDASLSRPIIDLNSEAMLRLRFDDVSNDSREFFYDIIHCDRNWEKSDIDNMDYIDGFTNEEIENIEYSINTFKEYAQYTLMLPNDDLKWTLSGNYLLVVYEEGDTNFPILTRRFMVVDRRIQVETDYQRPANIQKFDSHQEFDFSVNFQSIDLEDPLSSITGVVLQNHRWDNALFGLKPKFINREKLVFNYSDVICFPGLKEYRSFDTRSLRATKIGVNAIELNEDGNDVLLDLQENELYNRYQTINDANGAFVMYTEDSRNENMGADYTNVIFVLKSPQLEEPVYVLGGFNNHLPTDEHRMEYSEQRQAYVTEIYMKQGYYDYMFALKTEDGYDLNALQGSWYETENDYTILIYYSTRYDRYDQLIGFGGLNSNDF